MATVSPPSSSASSSTLMDAEARIDAVIRDLAARERERRKVSTTNEITMEGTFYARPLEQIPELLPVVSPQDIIQR